MNTDKYILQEVTTSAQEREWLDLPKKIYKGNRNWVCPLDQDITEVFDPARNELFADGEAVRWVVRNKAGEVVGRIAAFYNREKAAIEEQPTGGCGFFEAIDDQQVADMMFDASRMWLASRGMEAMDGPINFGQRRDWWGLLVEGYEFQPLYKNPYNPPYYKELFENYGFKNYFNQHSFIWRANVSEASERIFDRAERLLSTPGYHVENIDMNNLEDAAENFRLVYNKAWALFSGVRPMAQEEAMQMMKAMKPIIDPDIIFFAYFNDEPIGFFITVPDLNRIIGKFNGKFGLIAEAPPDVGAESPQILRPYLRHHLRHRPRIPRQGCGVGHHGALLALHDGDAEPLQDTRAGLDRRFQPRNESYDRDLCLRYAP